MSKYRVLCSATRTHYVKQSDQDFLLDKDGIVLTFSMTFELKLLDRESADITCELTNYSIAKAIVV